MCVLVCVCARTVSSSLPVSLPVHLSSLIFGGAHVEADLPTQEETVLTSHVASFFTALLHRIFLIPTSTRKLDGHQV